MMFGVKVNEILNRMSEDPAVFLALGETKVFMETKKALAKAGVNHIVLVKKLPFTATEKELAQMFGKFGSIDKIILPPTKALALVVFLERAEARAAMKGLAYKRYIYVPLYLEWAPEDILEQKAIPDNLEHMVEMDSDISITEGTVLDEHALILRFSEL